MDGAGFKRMLFGIELTILGGVFVLSSAGSSALGMWVALAGLLITLTGFGGPAVSKHPEDQLVP